MAELRTCPNCGAGLAADAPVAPCPACLMKLGLESWEHQRSVGATLDSPAHSSKRRFDPPAPAELAERLPQFEIIELLGCGGMGAVYKARQKSLDRLVALKIINPDAADDPGFAERFAREAKALAKLNHQNIVAVHEFGESESLYYFVMEFVDGTNLRQLIESRQLTPEQALQIVPQVCEALQFAHDEGIVHRDIKPENILIALQPARGSDARSIRVKIADFGLAKLLGQSTAEEQTLTASHQVMGTPRYMAPEQMEGSRTVDHRADIYSLGVVFYEMLTGELPLGRFAPPSQKARVDARLDEVVFRSLEKEPGRRYQHASDVQNDVTSIRNSPAPQVPPRRADASAASDDDFVIRNPRLPKIAQWICVYAIVCRPVMSLLMFLLSLLHPALATTDELSVATSLELSITFLLAPVDLLFMILIFIGGLKLRALRPWGPWLIKWTVFAEVLFGGFLLIAMAFLLIGVDQLGQVVTSPELAAEAGLTPDEVELLSRTDNFPLGAADVLICFLGICAVAIDVAMMLWLRKNAARLPLVAPGQEQRRRAVEQYASVSPPHVYPKKFPDDDAGRHVAGPAIGLILVGVLDLLPLAFGLLAVPFLIIAPVSDQRVSGQNSAVPPQVAMMSAWPVVSQVGAAVVGQQPEPLHRYEDRLTTPQKAFGPTWSVLLGVAGLVIALPLAVLLILAGTKMRKLELYPLALIASILALLPCHGACLIGIPIGIWSLVVLSRPDVRSAFQVVREQR